MYGRNNISRRQFLKRASTIAAGAMGFPYVIQSTALGKGTRLAPSNRIVMGCIGVGSMGTGDMRAFLTKDEVQIVAVCDVDTKHRTRAQQI